MSEDLSKYTQEVTNNKFVVGNSYKATPFASAPGLTEQLVKCTTNTSDPTDPSKKIVKFEPDISIDSYNFFEKPTIFGKVGSLIGLRGGKSKTRKTRSGKKSKAGKSKVRKSKARKSRRM
jgi:hypothetical protein